MYCRFASLCGLLFCRVVSKVGLSHEILGLTTDQIGHLGCTFLRMSCMFCPIVLVTHSCIIATIQLFHPDGREAVSRYVS